VLVSNLPNAMPAIGGSRADLTSPVVAAAGRLTHQKGFDVLVEAFRAVADRHPDWSLHVYGAGRLQASLERQITALGLAKTVVLKGFSATLPAELASASIFAMSSRYEGFRSP
jgi:glycosyltransferase involved in cell wall biosynthesis